MAIVSSTTASTTTTPPRTMRVSSCKNHSAMMDRRHCDISAAAATTTDDRETKKYRKRKRHTRQNTAAATPTTTWYTTIQILLGCLIGGSLLGALLQYTYLETLPVRTRIRHDDPRDLVSAYVREHQRDTPHWELPTSTHGLEQAFAHWRVQEAVEDQRRRHNDNNNPKNDNQLHNHQKKADIQRLHAILETWQDAVDLDILRNVQSPSNWIRPYLLLPPEQPPRTAAPEVIPRARIRHRDNRKNYNNKFFAAQRSGMRFHFQDEWDELTDEQRNAGPPVDYTDPELYRYPTLPTTDEAVVDAIPTTDEAVVDAINFTYPTLSTLQQLMDQWPQDEDYPERIIHETLWHFDFTNATEMAMAKQFRDAELPFKLIHVPEVVAASQKWTDEYLSEGFGPYQFEKPHPPGPQVSSIHPPGTAQESTNNFFAFYVNKLWDPVALGLAPTRFNDWSYREFAAHARFADAVRLPADRPHFYFQAGVPASERRQPAQSFITRDLPSFSATTEPNFLLFEPFQQKGIQCRFGERGVVAATHYDGGRNMIAMMRGAKRYILSPPNQCPKLGIFPDRHSPIYRHSLLNFGHLTAPPNSDMSTPERDWLAKAATATSVETVLKAGEVLYVPSHWFHYIVSLQQSAQCNVRSGIHEMGHPRFGGRSHVVEMCGGVPEDAVDYQKVPKVENK